VTRIAPGVVSLVAELRAHERQAAQELGQWKTHHEGRKVIDASQAAITLTTIPDGRDTGDEAVVDLVPGSTSRRLWPQSGLSSIGPAGRGPGVQSTTSRFHGQWRGLRVVRHSFPEHSGLHLVRR
jgi:hypothetical protein